MNVQQLCTNAEKILPGNHEKLETPEKLGNLDKSEAPKARYSEKLQGTCGFSDFSELPEFF